MVAFGFNVNTVNYLIWQSDKKERGKLMVSDSDDKMSSHKFKKIVALRNVFSKLGYLPNGARFLLAVGGVVLHKDLCHLFR